MSPDRTTSPPAGELRIDWGRAVFAGAFAAGVLWAIIVKITSVLDDDWPLFVRLTCAVALVCLPVSLIGVGCHRRAQSQRCRTHAVAAIIAGASALALPLALLTSGALEAVIRR